MISSSKRKAIRNYILIDSISAFLAWVIFWLYRKQWLYVANPEWEKGIQMWLPRDYLIGLVLVPLFWMLIHYLTGAYFDPYRKSRINEVYKTVIASFFGCLILGLTAIANDWTTFGYFFQITTLYFVAQVVLTAVFRIAFLNRIKRKLQQPHIGYNTLIVGGNGKSEKAYKEIINSPSSYLYIIKGYVSVDDQATANLPIPRLGGKDDLETIIDKENIQEVVIALESKEHARLEDILVRLSYRKLYIKILPDLYDFLSGSVKTSNVFDPIFVTIRPELITDWQKAIKRAIDFCASMLAVFILLPVYLLCILMVRLSSKGPILYQQERIGLFGKPFNIYKFRSMYVDAEKDGPALSRTSDPRITSWGKVMRKWRLDELPQFFNIIKGEMSLVGPRPERKFFIDQIIPTHPHYKYLHRVKPGLTSWGMVQFGYAETLDQMIERMKYDLLYIENCSILLDMKILIYTFKVLAQGRGK